MQCFAVENHFNTLQCRVVAAAAARGGEQAGAPSQVPVPANKDTRYLLLYLLSLHCQTSTTVQFINGATSHLCVHLVLWDQNMVSFQNFITCT